MVPFCIYVRVENKQIIKFLQLIFVTHDVVPNVSKCQFTLQKLSFNLNKH